MATVKQLIVRSPGRGHEHERTVDAVASGGFLSEDRPVPGGYRARFGTSDLVNIAIALGEEGYRLIAVGLTDRNYLAVADEDAEERMESAVVAALRDGDADRAYEVLESGVYGVQLATIEVVDQDRSRFEIAREGTMRVINGPGESHLLSSLSDYLTAHG